MEGDRESRGGAMALMSMFFVAVVVVALSLGLARLGLGLTLSVAGGQKPETQEKRHDVLADSFAGH